MANGSINDNNLTYLHPSVTSIINSEEISFQGSSGVVKLFMPIVSGKGVDNRTQLITSAEEFLFHYGEPNMKKYGQSAYNVLNWLTSGGEAYVLRVLPDNAGYAHAFLNIQTKVGRKKVRDINGDLVEVNDVFLKPVITYTSVNNTTESLLRYELEKTRDDITIDNYENNFLFTVYPYGRGSNYNNLGFRLTLNTSYDNIMDSRIYNFEVIQFDEYNTANLIEGPFYVSLDPDAISNSNESLFIEDVVNKYSKYIRCLFNTKVFDKITKIINPEVNPKKIDILSGTTRMINDVPEKYYDTITSNYEDVHMFLHKYDNDGNVLKKNGKIIMNIPDSADEIENTIIIIDNKLRDQKFDEGSISITHMKDTLKHVIDSDIIEKLDSIIKGLGEESVTADDPSCEIYKKLGELKTAKEELVEFYNNTFTNNKSDETFYSLNTLSNTFEEKSKQVTDLTLQVVNYCKAITKDLGNNLITTSELVKTEYSSLLNNKEVISVTAVAHKGKLNLILQDILDYKLGRINGNELDGIKYITSQLGEEYDFVLYNLVPSIFESEDDISETVESNLETSATKYNEVIELIDSLDGGYIPEDYETSTKVKIYDTLEEIIDSLYSIILECLGELCFNVSTKLYSKVKDALVPTVYSLKKNETSGLDLVLANPDKKKELIKRTKNNIDLTTASLVGLNSIIFTNTLQNFNNPIKFTNGYDGDFDMDNEPLVRNFSIRDHLIKAYKGLIDPEITNRRLMPFEHLLDANNDIEIKNAMITLARDIRKDVFCWLDTGLHASPEQTLNWKKNNFITGTQFVALFSQDFVVYDEFTGRDIKVTLPYFLAKKIPEIAKQYGLHYPIAGPRRGLIDGFKSISYVPNENYKEQLYVNKINYVESDTRRTKIGSQLTSDPKNTPLSNINNVLTVLDIKRNVELLVEDYQFEFEDAETMSALHYQLNQYLSKYINNRSCEEIYATVYASDYDKTQKILRVTITIKFNSVIERIVISLDVVK